MDIDQIKSVIDYSPETGKLTRKEKYQQWPKGHEIGWNSGDGYIKVKLFGEYEYAHRIAWAIHYGEWPKSKIDHKNRNRSDNRICNLRLADNSQNGANQSLRSDNTSGKKGVTWNSRRRKWQAQIQYKGIRKAGYFDSIEDAAAFYDSEAKLMCDEYFIKNGDQS